ncbi:unnamed protein product [Lymnaea stagnalis]|uniref:Uncharacterized protein n=1 Tax=Lymnaea stagnalis TaxID=6523 RepID=A0AAV2HZT0_LYMST
MRIALNESEFESQLESAKTEAIKSFGDQVMLLEKFVENPRQNFLLIFVIILMICSHVEVQVFGDRHGNYVYLFERDCSVQRRHQKIIEEAPAPGLTEEVRRSIGDAAVRAAKAVNYVGAGTVEFIMDKNLKFYFMEMNTRLQVEHPITEMITGTDLVEWQLRVSFKLIKLSHINSTFFKKNFFTYHFFSRGQPLIRIHLSTPVPGQDLRIETGVRQGDEVSIHYDPMIAKLVVWSDDRQSALKRTVAALRDYHIVGLNTNIRFLMALASHPSFQAGDVSTNFIPQYHTELFPSRSLSTSALAHAALAMAASHRAKVVRDAAETKDSFSPFALSFGLRLNSSSVFLIKLVDGETEHTISLSESSKGDWLVKVDSNHQLAVSDVVLSEVNDDKMTIRCSVDGVISSSTVLLLGTSVHLFTVDGIHSLNVPAPNYLKSAVGAGSVFDPVAPMPGVIEKVVVQPGSKVEKGDPLVVMIAMKMEYVIRAARDGVVEKVFHKPGDTVPKGTVLVHLQEE